MAQSIVPLLDWQFLMEGSLEGNMVHIQGLVIEVVFLLFSFLFILCVFFYIFDFLVSFAAGFSGGRVVDHMKHVTVDLSSQEKRL